MTTGDTNITKTKKATTTRRYATTINARLSPRHRALLEKVQKTNRLESLSQALRFVLDEMVGAGRG